MQTIAFHILCGVIVLFTLFLLFIYIKSDSFKSIPFYFNILFGFIITFDNVLRIIPVKDTEDTIENPTIWCKIQGFLLDFFDKLFIASITMYSLINYLIMVHPKLYEKRIKLFFVLISMIFIIISVVLTYLNYMEGMSQSSLAHHICYPKTSTKLKMSSDSVYIGILFIANLYFIIHTLKKLFSLIRKKKKQNQKIRRKNLKCHFKRFIFHLLFSTITLVYLLLIVNKILTILLPEIRDYIYIILCLITELFFTINQEFCRESMRILTCNKVDRFKKKDSEKELLDSKEFEDTEENDEGNVED